MDALTHYEKYWGSKDSKEKFLGYERNVVLPPLFKNGEKVLDLGCGDGAVSQYLKENVGVEITGADISPKALKIAEKRGVKTKLVDVEKKLPFNSHEFDVVFWGDNVEHLFDPESTLLEIKRILKKDGRLILSCPNMGYFRYRLYYLLNGALPDTEWTGFPRWGWSHIRFFNPTIMQEFLAAHKFKVIQVIGVNRRFPDSLLSKVFPGLFSMIMVVEAKSN